MKVTYQTCCGVDVHKSFLVATIVKTTGGIELSYQKKRFSTFNNSFQPQIAPCIEYTAQRNNNYFL